jgi:phosphoglycolate phosphatase
MAPRLILFDIDGTLVDAAGSGRRAMSRAFEEVFEIGSIEESSRSVRFAGMTDQDILDALAEVAGIESGRLDRARRQLEPAYLRALAAELARPDARHRAMPGAVELVRTLDQRDAVYLGLVTGNVRQGARAKLEPFGLNAFFPDGGFGSDHRDRRELARIARQRLSHMAGHAFATRCVVVVGDTEQDVDCARANGFRSVAVEAGHTPRAVLEAATPDALLPDLADLPRTLTALGLGTGYET